MTHVARSHTVRSLVIGDHPAVHALWSGTPGVGLSDSDAEPEIRKFLERNPGMSPVATVDGVVVGAVLCGHDGRRGYLHHLAVAEPHRGRGIARDLLAWCFERLAEAGIPKCNGFLLADNELGAGFWRNSGWNTRSDLRIVQKLVGRE